MTAMTAERDETTMAEAQHEAFDEKAWSKTMEPSEHVHTYGNFIELIRVGILGTLAVLFVLMIFAFGGGWFFNITAAILLLAALYTSVMGIASATTGWGPIGFVTLVSFVVWLFAVL